MIQAPDNLAWVRTSADRLTPFDLARLAASIQSAFTVDGVRDHLLAESIASAIYRYTLDCLPRQTIAATDIEELVGAVLTMLGLVPLARAYAQRGQRTEIQLDQLAAAEHYELAFYRRLAEHLHACADTDLELIQLRGLRACVMRLAGAQRWGRACRGLADEILAFIRARVRQLRPNPALALNIQVFE
jgi:hypothetical protein